MPSIRRREALAAAAGAVSVGLAGCTAIQRSVEDALRSPPARRVDPGWRPGPGTWAGRDYGPARTRHNPHATPPRTDPAIDWDRPIDDPHRDGGLVVADDTVYLVTESELRAFDGVDGQPRWELGIAGPAGLTYVDGRLYLSNWQLEDADVVARSPDGEERWRVTLPEQVTGLHERDGYVFVAGRTGYRTLHADTGEVVRQRDDRLRNVAADGEGLYAAYSGILVRYAVDGRTLEERWRAVSDHPTESVHPVIADDRIFVPRYRPGSDGDVAVYDAGGDRRDRIDLGFNPLTLAATAADPVVVPSNGLAGSLRSVRADGTLGWSADVAGRPTAIAAGDAVYAGNPLTALDAETGETLWRLDDVGPVYTLAATDSTVYVVTRDRLLAVRA